jgi:hypothetical protein
LTRWIIGVFLAICIFVALYFIFRPHDDCDYVSHARKAGVDFGATIKHVTSVKGNLGLTDSDITTLDQFRQDYAEKYRNICLDWKRGTIKDDEYNCRREIMDKVLDQFRLLNTISNAKDKAQTDQALTAIRQFASSGTSADCRPTARLVVNPSELDFASNGINTWTQVTNLGKKEAHYSFYKLPLAFVPTPASGSIAFGQMIQILFVRTKYPLVGKEINFFLTDDSNEQISLRIRINSVNYKTKRSSRSGLVKLPPPHTTLQDAMEVVKRESPDSKSIAADYLAAANLLDSAGNEAGASRAVTLAFAADKSLETNPAAQLTFAVLKTKSGDKQEAEQAFKWANKFASTTDVSPMEVRYFTGVADLRLGNWSSATQNLCSIDTKGWAAGDQQRQFVQFGAKELEIPGVVKAVNSHNCERSVLDLALARTTANDPEYSNILAALAKITDSHKPKAVF